MLTRATVCGTGKHPNINVETQIPLELPTFGSVGFVVERLGLGADVLAGPVDPHIRDLHTVRWLRQRHVRLQDALLRASIVDQRECHLRSAL